MKEEYVQSVLEKSYTLKNHVAKDVANRYGTKNKNIVMIAKKKVFPMSRGEVFGYIRGS